MWQFYFLSVLLNISAGLVLVYTVGLNANVADDIDLTEKEDAAEKPKSDKAFFNTPGFRLVLGLATLFTGVMKLLSVVHNDVPVIGDFFPAAAGLLGGISLLIEYYMAASTTDLNMPDFVKKFFIDWRKYIGIFCVFAGLLHFLFPQAPLL